MENQTSSVFEIKTREGTLTVPPKGNLCTRIIANQSADNFSCALLRWLDTYTKDDVRKSDMKDVLEVQESICAFCVKTNHVSNSR
jgi:hypothetical protein